MNTFFVYILASMKNGTLYIGLTNDLNRRIIEHKTKQADGFTAKYDVNQLVYFEEHQNYRDAFERERQLKKWKRDWKIRIIEEQNPNWDDLAKDW